MTGQRGEAERRYGHGDRVTTPLTVAIPGGAATADHRRALATLPERFHVSDDGAGAILVAERWESASTGQPREMVVLPPSSAASWVRAGEPPLDGPVAVALPELGDGAWEHAGPWLAVVRAHARVLRITTATPGDQRDALLTDAALLLAVTGPVVVLRHARVTAAGYDVLAGAGNLVVRLSGYRSTAGRHERTLDLVAAAAHVRVTFAPPGDVATGGVAMRADDSGTIFTPTTHEGGLRRWWRDVAAGGLRLDLTPFRDVVSLLDRLRA